MLRIAPTPLQKESPGSTRPISASSHRLPACLTISKSPPEITLMTNTPSWLVIGSHACGVLHGFTQPSTCNTTVTSEPGRAASSMLHPPLRCPEIRLPARPRSTLDDGTTWTASDGEPLMRTTRPTLGTFPLTGRLCLLPSALCRPLAPSRIPLVAIPSELTLSYRTPRYPHCSQVVRTRPQAQPSTAFPKQAARRAGHVPAGLL